MVIGMELGYVDVDGSWLMYFPTHQVMMIFHDFIFICIVQSPSKDGK
jgi:hypothetical protein